MITGFTILGIFLTIFGIFIHWTYKINKRNNIEFNKNTKDEFAEKRVVNRFTPIRGSWAVRVSDKQWITVRWDKRKGNEFLELKLPPNTYQNRSNFPIYITRKNWHVIKDFPPKEVTVEEYFKRQVM